MGLPLSGNPDVVISTVPAMRHIPSMEDALIGALMQDQHTHPSYSNGSVVRGGGGGGCQAAPAAG